MSERKLFHVWISIYEGHPDKLQTKFQDTVLDAILAERIQMHTLQQKQLSTWFLSMFRWSFYNSLCRY